MAWFAVVEEATGTLRSLGTVLADPLPAGLGAHPLASKFVLRNVMWDAATYLSTKDADASFIARPRPALVDRCEDIVNDARMNSVRGKLSARELGDLKAAIGEVLGGERYREPQDPKVIDQTDDKRKP